MERGGQWYRSRVRAKHGPVAERGWAHFMAASMKSRPPSSSPLIEFACASSATRMCSALALVCS